MGVLEKEKGWNFYLEFLVHGPLRKIDPIAAYASKLQSPNKPQPIH